MKGYERVKGATCLYLFVTALSAQAAPREAVYGGAVTLGGQIVPLFVNGYLIYLHQPNHLQVFRPDTQLAYEYEVPCPPQTSKCSATGVAASHKGLVALGIAYATTNGYASGIRLLDEAGKEIRFITTGRYVPMQLAFDKHGDLWAIGWARDQWINDTESKDNYHVARKYSPTGALLGEFLPKSLWRTKHGLDLGGRGYWTMYAADDRIGAIFNEKFAGATPEWIEWDLNGAVARRIALVAAPRWQSRAFDGKGALYAQFPVKENAGQAELRALETDSGKWVPVRANLPDNVTGFLLGADGDELVYRVNRAGNVHLVWAKPD